MIANSVGRNAAATFLLVDGPATGPTSSVSVRNCATYVVSGG